MRGRLAIPGFGPWPFLFSLCSIIFASVFRRGAPGLLICDFAGRLPVPPPSRPCSIFRPFLSLYTYSLPRPRPCFYPFASRATRDRACLLDLLSLPVFRPSQVTVRLTLAPSRRLGTASPRGHCFHPHTSLPLRLMSPLPFPSSVFPSTLTVPL